MKFNLFLDDERFPSETDPRQYVICRTSKEAIEVCKSANELPVFISFDHDLGENDTSMVFINWMLEKLYEDYILPEGMQFYVHSQNPIGKKNIEDKMNAIISYFKVREG